MTNSVDPDLVWYGSALFAQAYVSKTLGSLQYDYTYIWAYSGYFTEPHHEQTCYCHMQTTKVRISLHVCAVWSVPLLFAAWIVYLHLL